IMSDETIMVEGNGSIFLAGPYLVKAAIGEDIDAETLGGAVTHNAISGIADYSFPDEQSALDQVKKIIEKLAPPPVPVFNRIPPKPPVKDPSELYGIVPVNGSAYDMLEVIERIVDESAFEQFKKDYGQTILCGYARIDGWAVGIVANQRKIVKTKKGEMQMGG